MTDLNTVYDIELFVSLYCNVASGEPSIAECSFSSLLVAEVTLSHDWAANQELSWRSTRNVLKLLKKYSLKGNSNPHIVLFVNDSEKKQD